MIDFETRRVPPETVAAADLVFPEPLDCSFEGFSAEAFAILERLREAPHIEQYRREKGGIERYLRAPFKRFRDDLVVNWVLPNRLDFETEKNVFSRILKNDFGAGGSHHHVWMAFYRPPRRRLTDLQLSHGLNPDAFESSLFVGGYAKELLRQAKANIVVAPAVFLALVNPLLQDTTLYYRYGHGEKRVRRVISEPLAAVPEDLARADALWLRRRFPREDVIAWQGGLVRHALAAVRDFWPVYRFWLT